MYANLSSVQQSFSVAFADYVRGRERQGHSIVKMQTGDPDFATHPEVIAAATRALGAGHTRYCDSRGLLLLREALAEKLDTFNGIHADPARNLLVTHGAVHGVGMAIRALVNPGDEVIILEPYWRAYEANVLLAGGVPIFVRMDAGLGFALDAEAVLGHVTSKTRLIVINTPNNPSGAVYSENELRKLAVGAARRNVHLLCDEVYEALTFDSRRHYSPAADPLVSDWIVSVFSFSKTHAMTGWRVGYLAAREGLVDELLKLSQFSVTSLSPASQMAALHALRSPDVAAYAQAMTSAYEGRRDHIIARLRGTWLEGLAIRPEASFYMLFDFSHLTLSSLDLAKRLVDASGVAFTPGIAFGDSMDSYLRMCFAAPQDHIDRAIDSLLALPAP